MAAGPGSLFSDVPSYRQCEGTMADLTGKVAIVTGASKALGVAIAKALARTGATAAGNCATGGKERNERLQDSFDHLVTAGALYA